MGFSLAEVIEATGGRLLGGEARACARVAIDSRQVKPGDLFIAIPGERYDGHDFIPAAVAAGAVCVVAARTTAAPAGAAVVLVPDTVAALGALARLHRRRFHLPVVAVTGSTGKTSTKELIAAVGAVGHRVAKTSGNRNNEIGLPLTLLELEPEDELLVVEMGMRGPGQIAALASLAEPEIGVVTNIGLTHLELLGSQEAIAAAKGELVAALPATGTAVLCADDARCLALAALGKAAVLTYGFAAAADIRARDLQTTETGSLFYAERRQHPGFQVELGVPGEHHVRNALAAIAVGTVLGYDTEEIRRGLADFGLERGRGAALSAKGGWTVIDDTYNASPASVQAALGVLRARPEQGRKIAVLADMLELGAAAIPSHREVGAAAAQNGVSLLLTTGELGREIVAGALAAGLPATMARHYADKEQLIAALRRLLRHGDAVLVKGSRGMRMEEVVHGLVDA